MRSYEAARKSFNFLEFGAWALVVIGGIVAVLAISAAKNQPAPLPFIAAAPGIVLLALGVFGLAYIQIARATVDSAEYAQQ